MQKHLSFDPQKMLDEAEQLHSDIHYYMAKVIEEKSIPNLPTNHAVEYSH